MSHLEAEPRRLGCMHSVTAKKIRIDGQCGRLKGVCLPHPTWEV